MAEDAFVTDFEHIMADDITDDVRFIMYDSASGKTASAGEVSKYMMQNIHVDTTLTEEGSAAEAKAVGDALATKADTKGRYEDIVAGGAEQLMADGYETDKEPYLFRTTGGSADVGNREYLDKIVGGTVAWNQLYKRGNSGRYNGIVATLKSDGYTVNLDGTATSNAYIVISDAGIAKEYTTVIGHKYIVYKSTKQPGVIVYNDSGGIMLSDNANYTIGEATKSTKFYCRVLSGTTLSNSEVYFQIHDLTALFNPTIADYIYSLEQSHAGDGVAWFRHYFPKDYYPYDPGTLRSVEGVSAHETVGFNQWDGEWEVGGYAGATGLPWNTNTRIRSKTTNYIKAIPNTAYFINMPTGTGMYLDIMFYDSSKNFVGTVRQDSMRQFTTPSDAMYMRFATSASYGTTYKNDICINLSDPTRNGEYEPYVKHTYPLDSSLTLRGVPKLVDGKLAFDGDIYPPSGTVNRRYKLVDLGTLNWTTYNRRFVAAISGAKKQPASTETANILCPRFKSGGTGSSGAYTEDKVIWKENDTEAFYVNDSDYSTASAFKAAMSGVQLVYELATPTTETAEGYQEVQVCSPYGTEEYVTTGIVPVGHETRYPHDLKKKIETAPDSPSTDGTYLMKRSGGKNSYMALPSTPSANGAYVLTVTVSGGNASYSWTAKE